MLSRLKISLSSLWVQLGRLGVLLCRLGVLLCTFRVVRLCKFRIYFEIKKMLRARRDTILCKTWSSITAKQSSLSCKKKSNSS